MFEQLDHPEPVLVQAFMAGEGDNAVPGRVLGSYEVTLP